MALEKPDNTIDWSAEGTEPSSGKKSTGWAVGGKLPAPYFNWFWTTVSKWLAWLDQFFTASGSSNENLHVTAPGDLHLDAVGEIKLHTDVTFDEPVTFEGTTSFNEAAVFEEDATFVAVKMSSVLQTIPFTPMWTRPDDGRDSLTYFGGFVRIRDPSSPDPVADSFCTPIPVPKAGVIKEVRARVKSASGTQNLTVGFGTTLSTGGLTITAHMTHAITTTVSYATNSGFLDKTISPSELYYIYLISDQDNSSTIDILFYEVDVEVEDLSYWRIG